MSKLYILLFSVFLPSTAFCQVNKTDSLKLNDVILAFQESIEHKDSIKFKELFFNDHIAFIGIMSAATEWSIKKDYAEFEGIAVSDHLQFITEICATEKPQKEVFYNIEISHDNSIASVSFDYSYHSGESMIQWGHEKWNLVKVKEAWLITNVIYSIHFPDIEPFSLKKKNE